MSENFGLPLPEHKQIVDELLRPAFAGDNWQYVHFYPLSKQVYLDGHYTVEELLVLIQVLQRIDSA